jgi:hypothetical protein
MARYKWSLFFLIPLVLFVFWKIQPYFYSQYADKPDARLRAHLKNLPTHPIVFTSRTNASSFDAPAPEGEGFTFPGTIPWAAKEGRLRLLDPTGKVLELTHGKVLEDGSTLIDVMGPSVNLEGTSVYFAGRKAAPFHGRWRIYNIDLKSGFIRQITGGPEDPGCIALPPMRYGADGKILSEKDRKQIDYDDVDPAEVGPDGFAFASSRLPDLGRDHARRATQIWIWKEGDASPHPISANRNNDRWPAETASDSLLFSLWSRNREAVTEDLTDIRPVSTGGKFATEPTDHWMAASLTPNGTLFGFAVKTTEHTLRPRPLFNGRIAFMTESTTEPGRFLMAQADWGYFELDRGMKQGLEPNRKIGTAKLDYAPGQDSDKKDWSVGCPSPCPGGMVLFSAAKRNTPAATYGIHSISDNWQENPPDSQLLFDDPALEDSEPVAVYPRTIALKENHLVPAITPKTPPENLTLADGKEYKGPMGYVENLAILQEIRNPIPWYDVKNNEKVDPRVNPLVPPPPNVEAIAFYAAYRDRFDDPVRPRIPGEWKKLAVIPIDPEEGALDKWVPSDPLMTTVIVGLDNKGKIAKWMSKRDLDQRTFYAYAGDHYSQIRPKGFHYCNGCHTGHTFHSNNVREKSR